MHALYDAEADAAYIYLTPTGPIQEAAQQTQIGGIVLDLDEEGRLIGIEIVGAAKRLRPETIESFTPYDGV